MSKASLRIVLCIGILVLSSMAAFGQLTTGTIGGSVSDQSGAAIPGATVTVKNADTGITRTNQSNETGKYDALRLPDGNYEISASLTGFQKAFRTRISP